MNRKLVGSGMGREEYTMRAGKTALVLLVLVAIIIAGVSAVQAFLDGRTFAGTMGAVFSVGVVVLIVLDLVREIKRP